MSYIDDTVQHETALGTQFSLGATDIEPGSVVSLDGLVAGQDYLANETNGTINLRMVNMPAYVHFRFRKPEIDVMAPVRDAIEAIRATGYDADANRLDQLAAAVSNLRNYLALDPPTAAQTVGALKLLIRVVLFLLKRQGY